MVAGLTWWLNSAPAATPCMQLAGVVQDHVSRQPLAARLYLKTPTGRSDLGSSTAGTGRFAVGIACSAMALIIERPGYRPQMLRLNLPTSPANQGPVEIIIPLVAVDKLETDKPYLQTEQTHFEQTGTVTGATRPQRNAFVISDALSGRVLAARTCFFFTKTGEKRCIDANDAGQFRIDFAQKDIVAMEVTASGYQTYQGNLIVDELDGRQLQHTIRLTRELTLLSVRLDASAGGCELRGQNTDKVIRLIAVPGQREVVVATDLLPQPYELLILDRNRTVREQRTVTLRGGLNVIHAVARQAVAVVSSPVSPSSAPLIDPESLPMLYFEQGSYTLLPSSKAALVQTAAYLLQHPDLKLRLAGHTDREGDERLNRYLSENRAKVVSTFLFAQGVPDERMELVGFGSRFPVASGDTEENRAKNRRVHMKFIVNQNQ